MEDDEDNDENEATVQQADDDISEEEGEVTQTESDPPHPPREERSDPPDTPQEEKSDQPNRPWEEERRIQTEEDDQPQKDNVECIECPPSDSEMTLSPGF